MIWMAYACNDPSSGQPLETPYVEQIQFELGDYSVDLQGGRVKVWLEVVKRYGMAELIGHVGRCVVPVKKEVPWHGNWCWNAALIPDHHARKVFNYLATLKGWHCEGGPGELYEAFNARRPVSKGEWRRLL